MSSMRADVQSVFASAVVASSVEKREMTWRFAFMRGIMVVTVLVSVRAVRADDEHDRLPSTHHETLGEHRLPIDMIVQQKARPTTSRPMYNLGDYGVHRVKKSFEPKVIAAMQSRMCGQTG